jgi:hypothetical protein
MSAIGAIKTSGPVAGHVCFQASVNSSADMRREADIRVRSPQGAPVAPAAKAIDGGQVEGKPVSELPRN